MIGTLYGAAMAHFGGWVDDVMMRIIEVLNSLPSLLITIMIMMVLGNNLFALLVALSITAWCNTARQTRGMIKQLKESEYVYAAEVTGSQSLADHYQTLCAEYAEYPAFRCIHHNSFFYLYGGRSEFPGNWIDCTGDQSRRFDLSGTADDGFLSQSVDVSLYRTLRDRYGF